jgi:hypothetical protein
VCDVFQNSGTRPTCSYFTMLREPIDRIVTSYFHCNMRPTDILCATSQLDASKTDIIQWAFHQRNYLFTQLTIDSHYCIKFPQNKERAAPCRYRERILHEQTDLEPRLQFILEDLEDRFAVLGIFEHFEESLLLSERVRTIN